MAVRVFCQQTVTLEKTFHPRSNMFWRFQVCSEAMMSTRTGARETLQMSLTHKDMLVNLTFSKCQIHKESLQSQYPTQAVG